MTYACTFLDKLGKYIDHWNVLALNTTFELILGPHEHITNVLKIKALSFTLQ